MGKAVRPPYFPKKISLSSVKISVFFSYMISKDPFWDSLEKILGFRKLINLYPPYLGAGICCRYISPDFRKVRMQLRYLPWNKNYVGTHFGGSLYAMCDPIYMVMLMYHLGEEYFIIDKGAYIEFLKAVKEDVFADFVLEEEILSQIKREVERKRKVIWEFREAFSFFCKKGAFFFGFSL